TQVVSHHDLPAVDQFVKQTVKENIELPGIFGVFFYRSARRQTLATLQQFLPVPVEGLTRDFAEGMTPEEVCARTIRALRGVGARHFYVSNLPVGRARQTLDAVLKLADA
ncbi:MAG: hypothetical protein ABI652_08515, partial [Acidobacteriota bacterium]